MRTDDAVSAISNMVMFPLTFVSNVFVPPETLPGWRQASVEVNSNSVPMAMWSYRRRA